MLQKKKVRKITSDKSWTALSLAVYGSFLTQHVLNDKFLQATVLSAFPIDQATGVTYVEPLYIYRCFTNWFTNFVLPDRPCLPPIGTTNEGFRVRGAFRYALCNALWTRQGHPTVMTLLLGALYKSLEVPCHICVGFREEATMELSYETRRKLLNAQLCPEDYSSLKGFPVYPPPYIWLEVYWPETRSFVGVELYSPQFNFQNEYSGVPYEDSVHLSKVDLPPKKLVPKEVLTRVKPQIITPDAGRKKVASLLMFPMDDSDSDEELADNLWAEPPKSPAPLHHQPEILFVIEEGWDPQRRLLIKDEALQANLTATSQEKLTFNPFQKFARHSADGSIMVECFFNKSIRFVLSVTENFRVRDVSVRYLSSAALTRIKSYRRAIASATAVIEHLYADIREPLDPRNTHYLDLDESVLRSLTIRFEMPSSLAGFKESEVYVLPSILRSREVLISTEHPVGFFKGERVFLRKDVRELKTRHEWEDIGRIVNAGEVAKKKSQKKDKTGAVTIQDLFTEEQTTPIDDAPQKGRVGDTSQRYVVIKKGVVPYGWVHLSESKFPGVQKAARQLDIAYQIAITKFVFNGQGYDSVKDGVVIAQSDEDALLEKQKEVAIWLKRQQINDNREKSIQWWRVLLKMIAAVSSDSS